MVKQHKRIGIDARFYGPIGKGLGRYTQEIVDNIIKIDDSNEYVIFLARDNFDEFVSPNERVQKVRVNARCYSWREQFILPFIFARYNLDLIHFTHFNVPLLNPVKFVVTIHDLILTKFPTVRASTRMPWLYALKNLAYKLVIASAVRRSKMIITVSNFTKDDISSKFRVQKDKIVVTYGGAAQLDRGHDNLFVQKLSKQQTLADYQIGKKFLLYVGNAYPHKNLEGLLRVFSKINKKHPDLVLVLVGKDDYFYNRVKEVAQDLGLWQEKGNNNKVLFPGYVPDAKLDILYQKASAYIFPSFYEGFGLPPLEAMAKGCPVLSSNRSAMPEILGEAALYFNPESEKEIVEAVDLILSQASVRERLIKAGHEQVKKYNWWECARETLEVYQKVLGRR